MRDTVVKQRTRSARHTSLILSAPTLIWWVVPRRVMGILILIGLSASCNQRVQLFDRDPTNMADAMDDGTEEDIGADLPPPDDGLGDAPRPDVMEVDMSPPVLTCEDICALTPFDRQVMDCLEVVIASDLGYDLSIPECRRSVVDTPEACRICYTLIGITDGECANAYAICI